MHHRMELHRGIPCTSSILPGPREDQRDAGCSVNLLEPQVDPPLDPGFPPKVLRYLVESPKTPNLFVSSVQMYLRGHVKLIQLGR